MTFYNPFFPPFPRYPLPNSTPNTQTGEKPEKSIPQIQESPKSNHKSSIDLSFITNYLKDTDTLILLGLLFLLYNEEKQNFPLMFCLFLILLEQ